MTLGLLVVMLLTQAPPDRGAVVVLTRRAAATAAVSDAVTRDLRKALSYAGVDAPIASEALPARLVAAGVKDSRACDGNLDCAVGIAKKLKVANLISLKVSQVGKELTIEADALRAQAAERFATEKFTINLKEMGGVFTAFAPFAERVRAALAPKAPVPPPPPKLAEVAPVDVPRQAPVEAPPPVLTPELSVERPGPPAISLREPAPSRLPIYTLGAGTIVAAGLGAVLLGTGLAAKGRVDQRVATGSDQQGSPLTHSEALALSGSANSQLTGALVCGLTSLALGTATGFLWARAKSAQESHTEY